MCDREEKGLTGIIRDPHPGHTRPAAERANGPLSGTTKPSNPKDQVGSSKVPMHLVPTTAIAHEALVFLDGALKYGKYNWRVAGVRASIYLDAMMRHYADYLNGEDLTADSALHHLASIRACAGILLDAAEVGKLTDDRPPRAPMSELLERLNGDVRRLLKAREGEELPHQWTLHDEIDE